MGDITTRPWWHDAVFYQVYPLSYQDSNDDGFGDLRGLISRIPYLAETLGVDAIWVSPFYRSPMRDWGYDVSDHTDVGPVFGTLADAQEMIDKAHDSGIKVIVDFVMNHTSDEHPWFAESRSSRDHPKRDWYVWADGKDGGPPNNWVAVFSGPAWSFDEHTGQWFRHTYLPTQPDLNWRNPEVVEAMLGVLRFWLDRGVDGFRVDAAHQMMKDPENRDNPPVPPDHIRPWKDMGPYDEFIHLYDYGHPDVHEVHRQIREVLDAYGETFSVGEVHIFELTEWASYYGDFDELHMPFNFHLMASEWEPAHLRAKIESVLWHIPEGAVTNWTLGNHDEIRIATRLPDGHERIAATLVLTLPGPAFLYYGEELGMEETVIPDALARDPWGQNVSYLSRDGARTPMQWTPATNAGFTAPGVSTWLPFGHNSAEVNVESELADPDSVLNMYRRLIELRKKSEALRGDAFASLPEVGDDLLVYSRGGGELTVVLNFGSVAHLVAVTGGRVVFSTHHPGRDGEVVEGEVAVGPREGVVVAHR